jgi:hypothetical protein
MAIGSDVHHPDEAMQVRGSDTRNWAELALYAVVDSIEDYARAKPLSFGLWAFGIGFVLGWKLKLW